MERTESRLMTSRPLLIFLNPTRSLMVCWRTRLRGYCSPGEDLSALLRSVCKTVRPERVGALVTARDLQKNPFGCSGPLWIRIRLKNLICPGAAVKLQERNVTLNVSLRSFCSTALVLCAGFNVHLSSPVLKCVQEI